jgi:hypothetical protein
VTFRTFEGLPNIAFPDIMYCDIRPKLNDKVRYTLGEPTYVGKYEQSRVTAATLILVALEEAKPKARKTPFAKGVIHVRPMSLTAEIHISDDATLTSYVHNAMKYQQIKTQSH